MIRPSIHDRKKHDKILEIVYHEDFDIDAILNQIAIFYCPLAVYKLRELKEIRDGNTTSTLPSIS
jgi:hypothetical protein